LKPENVLLRKFFIINIILVFIIFIIIKCFYYY
jgi:hypothetical protein